MERFLRSLWKRRLPQVLVAYLGSGWGLLEFTDWASGRGFISSSWPDLILLAFLMLLPAVSLVTWIRGYQPSKKITRVESIFVPTNLLLVGILAWLSLDEPEFSTTQTEVVEHETGRLTFLELAEIRDVVFSPDSKQLALLVKDSIGVTLLTLPLDGSAPPDTLMEASRGDPQDLQWSVQSGLTFRLFPRDSAGTSEEAGRYGFRTRDSSMGWVCRQRCSFSPDGEVFAGFYDGSSWDNRFFIGTARPYSSDSIHRTIPLSEPTRRLQQIEWSPTAPLVAVRRPGWVAPDGTELYRLDLVNVDTGEEWEVATANRIPHLRWGSGGLWLDFLKDSRWTRQYIDPTAQEPLGRVEESFHTSSSVMDFSRDGTMVVYSRQTGYSARVGKADLASDSGGALTHADLGNEYSVKNGVSVSPDGTTLAFWDGARPGGISLWDWEAKEIGFRPFPDTVSTYALTTAWNPEGTALLAIVVKQGQRPFHVVRLDPVRDRAPEIIARGAYQHATWCSNDLLIYQKPGNRDFEILDAQTGESRPFFGEESKGWMFHPACSPDGGRVAFQYNHADGRGLWTVGLGGGEEAMLVQDTADTFARPVGWSPNGDWVYYYRGNSWPNWVLGVPARGGDPELLTRIPAATASIHISRDGHTIGLIEKKQTRDLYLARWPQDSLTSMPRDTLSGPSESDR